MNWSQLCFSMMKDTQNACSLLVLLRYGTYSMTRELLSLGGIVPRSFVEFIVLLSWFRLRAFVFFGGVLYRYESPMRPFQLVARGFPSVRSTADIAVVFGTEPGVVKSVAFDAGSKLLTMEVVPPQYTADSGWEDDGWLATPFNF